MQRLEEDGLEDFGWFIAMLVALGFLFFAVVYLLQWLGWLS